MITKTEMMVIVIVMVMMQMGMGDGYAGEAAKVRMDARVVSVLCATGHSTLSLDSGASALLRTTLHLDS